MTRSGEGLSERLACLDLGCTDAIGLAEALSEEALSVLGGRDAVTWIYHAALGRLFHERAGAEAVSMAVTENDLVDLMREPTPWSATSAGVRGRLVDLSFGLVARHQTADLLGVPLVHDNNLLGLVLITGPGTPLADGAAERAARFARQASLVLLNHRQLQRAQQSETQLRALFETASELSSNLELETVLTAIVERACTVVKAPVSYIMLVDDGSGITMRITTGTELPAFAGLRLVLGAGLGGRVAASRRVLYTSDYLDDARFDHLPEVDAAVRGESIRSILGAPMKVSERFVGVLFVADRVVRAFSEADVVLVTSLANHAATAIHNAELYYRVKGTLAELAHSNAVVHEQNLRLERAGELHAQLSRAVLGGQGLPDIVGLIAEVIGGHVLVFDHHHQLLVRAGRPSDPFGERQLASGLVRLGGNLPQVRDLLVGRATETFVIEPCNPDRFLARLVVPLVANAELLGSVWLETTPGEVADTQPLLEQAARVIALELLKERAVAEVHRRLGRELLDDLLVSHQGLDDGLARRASELGVDLSQPHRIVRIKIAIAPTAHDLGAVSRATEATIGMLRHQPWCRFVGGYAQSIVGLADAASVELADHIQAVLDRTVKSPARAHAVVSPPCQRVEQYAPSFAAEGRVLRLYDGRAGNSVADLGEAWVLTLLSRSGDEAELRRFIDSQIGPVLTYEKRHELCLVETLDCYLKSERSPTRTAAALNVHVNTVYYRLDRVRRLLGADFSDSRRTLDLRVALLAHRLLS